MYVRECDLSVNEVLFGNVMVMRTHICQQQRAPPIRLFPLLCMRSSFRWFSSPDTHVWVFYWVVAATEGMGLRFARACSDVG